MYHPMTTIGDVIRTPGQHPVTPSSASQIAVIIRRHITVKATSTTRQDLTVQRQQLTAFGVPPNGSA